MLSTDSATITGQSPGSTTEYIEADETDGGSTARTGGHFVQYTDSVGTSATTILSLTDETVAHVVVQGVIDDGSFSPEFTDIVHFMGFGGTNVISSLTRGTPAGRTYSQNGRDMELAMGSDSYDVAATAVAVRNVSST